MKIKIGTMYLNTDHIVRAKVAQAKDGEGSLIADKYRLEIDTVDGKAFYIESKDINYQTVINVLNTEFLDLTPVGAK